MADTVVPFITGNLASSQYGELSKALQFVELGDVEETYLATEPEEGEDRGFLNGRIMADKDVIPFSGAGVKMLYKTKQNYGGGIMPSDAQNAYPIQFTPANYDNLRLNQSHLRQSYTDIQFDRLTESILKSGTVDSEIIADWTTDIYKAHMIKRNLSFITDQQGVIGQVAAVSVGAAVAATAAGISMRNFGAIRGVAWTGYIPVTLRLGGHSILAAFQPGRTFSICQAPSDWATTRQAPILHNRTWMTAPVQIDTGISSYSGVNPANNTFDGGYLTVTVLLPYTVNTGTGTPSTEYATVLAAAQAITAGDVITEWGGMFQGPAQSYAAVTSDTVLPYMHINQGALGLAWWFSKRNVDMMAAALASTYGGYQQGLTCEVPGTSEILTIDRTNGAFDYLVPFVINKQGAAPTLADFETIFEEMARRNRGAPIDDQWVLVCAEPARKYYMSLVGSTQQNRYVGEMADRKIKHIAQYGLSAVTIQSPHLEEPVYLATSAWIPTDMIVCMRLKDLRLIQARPFEMLTFGGSIDIPVFATIGGLSAPTDQVQRVARSDYQAFMRNCKRNAAITQFVLPQMPV